jgi:Ca2+:H+ antiporter
MRFHHALKREWPLVVNVAAAALFFVFGAEWVADLSNPVRFAAILASLFAVILLSAFA